MLGIDANTGKALDGVAHIRQSIADILSTPIGSRVMRRDYGSRLFDLVDAPMVPSTIVDIYAEVADALAKWEPRFRLSDVRIAGATNDGRMLLDVSGVIISAGREIALEGVVV